MSRRVFLKNLTLKGFKSFADTTSLDLEPGVTVVVGPNGSGKSNVVDAVAWVLGAQAPKSIRSSKMDDVIFAGTAKRAALGRAEVALTIDNSDGILPVQFSEVTVKRTLFRNGDSEYSINQVPCRLLDIQELLSDAGVGRQQHVIISQGQIDAVLNARPEDRRLIIEEAAGVLKYRKRKEKAERRLVATEANLTRIQDLLREVKRGLRPLEKQADAARRYDSLVAELTQLRKHLAGRELSTMQRRLAEARATQEKQNQAEAAIKGQLASLDTKVLDAETRLTAQGGDDLGDDLAAFEGLAERAKGQAALVAERVRSIEAARNEATDQTVIATLEADANSLTTEIAEVAAHIEAGDADGVALLADEAEMAKRREAFDAEHGDGPKALGSEIGEVRAELNAAAKAVERSQASMAQAKAQIDRMSVKHRSANDRRTALTAAAEEARSRVESLAAERVEAAEALVSAESSRSRAATAATSATSEARAWTARVEALELALDQARSAAGAEQLAGLDGVLGTLLDLVAVDDGFETAFEAAIGEALTSVVVESSDAARAALTALHADDAAGAVVALDRVDGIGGSATASAAAANRASSGMALRDRVRGQTPEVDRLLDRLLAAAVLVDGPWADALDVALAEPDLIVVTRDGDRFAATGWRTGLQGSGATGAALEEAQAKVVSSAQAAQAATSSADAAEQALAQARSNERNAVAAEEKNQQALELAERDLERLAADLADGDEDRQKLDEAIAAHQRQIEVDSARVTELEAALPELVAAESQHEERVARWREERGALAHEESQLRQRRSDHERRLSGLSEKRQVLTDRLEGVEEGLRRNVAKRDEAAQRRQELDRRLHASRSLASYLDGRITEISEKLASLRIERQAQSAAAQAISAELDSLRRDRIAQERALEEGRELARRADMEASETNIRIEAAVETLRRELDCDPQTAMDTECPELADGVTAPARTRELERELRLMGPINPLALDEYEALAERHEFLKGQLDDVKASRKELNKVISSIDDEIVGVFTEAFADVSENFTALFETLFPGGRGRLVLTNPENMLETGIELQARPGGKNVRKLSLLSGGERSLTALAYLFAVFRSRPSPFYVMDEVEAALDDVNLHRFLDLVAEFRDEAQLIIVSHQKRTMEAGDVLYGVTMQAGGSSTVLSEKVRSETANPAEPTPIGV